MRWYLSFLIIFLGFWPGQLRAQPVTFEGARVGFRGYADDKGVFKAGVWTPVYVTLKAGKEGLSEGDMALEAPDSENVGTIFSLRVPPLAKNEIRTELTYTKPLRGAMKMTLATRDDGTFSLQLPEVAPHELGSRLYLTLGRKIPELQEALLVLARQHGAPETKDTWPRYAAYEDQLQALPTNSFGYDGIDMMFLATDNVPFLTGLQGDGERRRALAQWVRRGGRLVIGVSARNQELVHDFLAKGWNPPLPVVLPRVRRPVENQQLKLKRVENWAKVQDREFRADLRLLADLGVGPDMARNWEVLADTSDQRPLITRLPYGRGNLTFLAFDLETEPFKSWGGRTEFMAGLVNNLEPPVTRENLRDRGPGDFDLATQLQRTLDQFDVPIISFGWVALFILIYIIIVGPLDYLLLKKVFNKLELTWITFPAVVILVSGLAYFTAYALKGKDMKIHKVDLVDFDQRTDPQAARAYGHCWFTIMSPRIQNYIIGVEPALQDWGLAAAAEKPGSAEGVSWLGRPEFDGPGSFGQSRSSFLRRPYEYAGDAAGLRRVPIPVWTSKAFTAAWEMPLSKLPFETELIYDSGHKDKKLTGTIKSNLPVDLEDVWLFYRDRRFQQETVLPGKGKEAMKVTLKDGDFLQGWPGQPHMVHPLDGELSGSSYDPTSVVKWIMFHQKVDKGENYRNHSLRFLDLSWRQKDNDPEPREVILFGRVARQGGAAATVASSLAAPAALWLGKLPGDARSRQERPALDGTMIQDTYVRAILPVRPKE